MIPRVTQFPIPDRAAARTLGAALRRLDYSDDGIVELLGDEAFDTGLREVPVQVRRLPQTKLATAVKLFFLELPVARADALEAFGEPALAAIEQTGLAAVGADVVPRSRITTI